MKNTLIGIMIALVLGFLAFLSFSTLMPIVNLSKPSPETDFSVKRALNHVVQISKKPHYTGSENHSEVRNYIVEQFQEMGLQVHTQNGYVMNKYHVLTNPENIVTRIEGTDPRPGSDLLVLAHYDSAPHSSFGAADDGASVAAILEAVRALKARGEEPKNDIIICITDAEEIGLLGAQLFAEEHEWVEEVGLMLNFEARGSGGPSNTILETNHGNAKLIKDFSKARAHFPMVSSLMYDIYKKMPNDTDATVFREEKDIPGFFFAFIDRHYNYHTARDTPDNLDVNSLAHQGDYLLTTMTYFGNQNLADYNNEGNRVFFNFPFIKVFHYSDGWIYPLLILGWLFFLGAYLVGRQNRSLDRKAVINGFKVLVGILLAVGLVGYGGWKLIEWMYPGYHEIQQGFPYNGHDYILGFVFISLAIAFYGYGLFEKTRYKTGLLVAPILLWLLLNTGFAILFKGASYFIFPLFFLELAFAYLIWRKRPSYLVALCCAIPGLFILLPLVAYIPVALGMKFIFAGMLLLTLLFCFLLPLFLPLRRKKIIAGLALLVGFVFMVKAHQKSGFSTERPKPNSLIYQLDLDNQAALWQSYDGILDDWTRQVLDRPEENPGDFEVLGSKYGAGIQFSQVAETLPIPGLGIEVEKDSLSGDNTLYKLRIVSDRDLDRIAVYSPFVGDFSAMKINGLPYKRGEDSVSKIQKAVKGENRRILTYYPIDRDTLWMEFELPKAFKAHLNFYAASYDLLDNPWVNIKPRERDMIPRPFVLNDALITKQRLDL